jgi:hypothetical protein
MLFPFRVRGYIYIKTTAKKASMYMKVPLKASEFL